jgi:inosine/xanthosine triphosphatase
MHIFVGSKNPAKIEAVRIASQRAWPEVVIEGIEVASGIDAQPRTDDDTRQGARNRAAAVLLAGRKIYPKIDEGRALGIGLEGGVFKQANQLWSTVWAAVTDDTDHFWEANGARFLVPEPINSIMKSGKEMGPVVEEIIGEKDIRSKQGMIGVITNDFVSRAEEYAGIARMSLGLWYGRDWAKKLKK